MATGSIAWRAVAEACDADEDDLATLLRSLHVLPSSQRRARGEGGGGRGGVWGGRVRGDEAVAEAGLPGYSHWRDDLVEDRMAVGGGELSGSSVYDVRGLQAAVVRRAGELHARGVPCLA